MLALFFEYGIMIVVGVVAIRCFHHQLTHFSHCQSNSINSSDLTRVATLVESLLCRIDPHGGESDDKRRRVSAAQNRIISLNSRQNKVATMNQIVLLISAALLPFSTIFLVNGLAPSNPPDRRAFFESLATGGSIAFFSTISPAFAEQEAEFRQGNKVTAFNGLAFNYRGGEFGGLDASTIDEPTVTYKEFNERLKAGDVVFVEFLAPDGDVAYATFKDDDKKIRIGEGYPIEQHDGYSSPLFCVRAVKNAGVPYKFTVKGLAKFSQ